MTTLDDRPTIAAPEYPPLPRMVKPTQPAPIDPALIAPSPRPDPEEIAAAIAEARARAVRELIPPLPPMVGMERGGVIYTANNPEELMRLLTFGSYGTHYCYCSPTRGMYLAGGGGGGRTSHPMRVAAYFVAWAIAALLLVMLF